MRVVIEKDVLQESLSGQNSETFIAAHASVIGVTPAILKEYMTLIDNFEAFKIWFDKTFSVQANHYLICTDSIGKYKLNTSCIHSNYIGAAFYCSAPIIAKSSKVFNHLAPSSWGISIIESNQYKHSPATNQSGAKVAEILSLTPGGNTPPAAISKYLLKENRIFIYDKNINLAGADFICEITKFCASDCKIVIVSNFGNNQKRGLLDRIELQKLLNRNKSNGTIEVLQADKETIEKYHDRFIFLGDRFQLTLSSGVDCFGRNPEWKNSDGDITVHCIHNSGNFMEFKSGRKTFKFKSKG